LLRRRALLLLRLLPQLLMTDEEAGIPGLFTEESSTHSNTADNSCMMKAAAVAVAHC
jgi:hypothetical protein